MFLKHSLTKRTLVQQPQDAPPPGPEEEEEGDNEQEEEEEKHVKMEEAKVEQVGFQEGAAPGHGRLRLIPWGVAMIARKKAVTKDVAFEARCFFTGKTQPLAAQTPFHILMRQRSTPWRRRGGG